MTKSELNAVFEYLEKKRKAGYELTLSHEQILRDTNMLFSRHFPKNEIIVKHSITIDVNFEKEQ